MNTLRLSRVVGFGTKPPQDFAGSPVTLGTASGSTIRFDAAFDRGVAPHHARIEWNGEAWYLLDAGSPEGTWADGRRLDAAHRITGPMEFSLGASGPKVKVEVLAAPQAAGVPVPQAPVAPPQISAPRKANGNRTAMVVVAAVALVGLAAGAWVFLKARGDKRPSFAQALNNSGLPAVESSAIVAQNEPSPGSGAGASGQTGHADPAIPAELLPVVEELKNSSWQQAVREFWVRTKTHSPYAQAILRHEDLWLAKQIPWLQRYQESGGSTTGKGMDFPGAFVPETIYPDADKLGIPLSPPDVSALVGAAVAENTPAGGGAIVASLANISPAPLRFPSRVALQDKFRTYAGAAKDASAPKAHAFFVGINRFENPDANLVGCRNDVGAQAKVLTTQGIFPAENLRLLTDTRKGTPDYPSKQNVVAGLTQLIEKAGPNDIIYIGFSTHGGFDGERKDSCLLMADMSLLYGQELTAILAKAKAKNIVITMDACHSGGMPGMGGAQFANARGSKAPPIPDSFYQMLGSSRGHVVIRACRADQSTPDVRTLGHGILTLAIVAGLTGDADANGDGIVTLSELRIYVTTAIPIITKRADELGAELEHGPLEPTFTSSSFGEAGDLPLTVVQPKTN